MLQFAVRAIVSGLTVAAVAMIARRSPTAGALIASLPLVSVLGMIWLWHDTGDRVWLAAHAEATFWYVIPSLPMFLVIPALLRHGIGFLPALLVGCALTVSLYLLTVVIAGRFGLTL